MDKVAVSDPSDRRALFSQTAATRGLANIIVEKDFWVCWTLKRLFEIQKGMGLTLVFKGGTSLSKAYDAIRRFSEDIDLSFDRADFGYEHDPEAGTPSGKEMGRRIEAFVKELEKHIANTLLPALRNSIEQHLGSPDVASWRLELDEDNPQCINFFYPTALSQSDYSDVGCIKPRVRLEFGARGDPWPTEERPIQPYAAEEFPDFFEEPSFYVTVLSAQRTFWEKATALHAEYHRPSDKPIPQNVSRHYSDLAALIDTEHGNAAIANVDLLEEVAEHKATFFRSGWARYDTARPGTLKLVPPDDRLKELRKDYRDMAPMMFDETPLTFEELIERIRKIEEAINSRKLGQ